MSFSIGFHYSFSQDIILKDDLIFYQADSSQIKERIKKSPTIAILLSAAIPGAGQFYTESYWKIPIILGLAAYYGYEWNNMNKQYRIYKDLYAKSREFSPPTGILIYQNIRDFYKTERDKFAWYLGVLYFANIIDAYVDASLFEFDVSNDLSLMNSSENVYWLKIKIYF